MQPGMLVFQSFDGCPNLRAERDLARAACPADIHANDGHAIQKRGVPWRCRAVGDGGERRETHTAPIGQINGIISEVRDTARGGHRAHGLLGAVGDRAAARPLQLQASQLLRQGAGGDAIGLQGVGAQSDAYFTIDATATRDAADAMYAEQRFGDGVIDEP